MEEILKELIKNTTENGPQKHFYSNLSITEPIQKQVEISSRISKGIEFIQKALDPKNGFQSHPSVSRNCKEPFHCDLTLSKEIYTSLLALQLFGGDDNFEINFSESFLKNLMEFVLPECAITTINLFKASSDENSELPEGDLEELNNLIPDDCNTTSLLVSILLREGILDYQPAASIAEFLLSHAPISEGIHPGNHYKKFPGVIRTFLRDTSNAANEPELDAITCANVLYLYYQTDMNLNNEENVESTELFLLETLKGLLTTADQGEEFDQIQSNNNATKATNASLIIPNALHHSTDAFIFFLSRVTSISEHAADRFNNLLKTLLDKRISKISNTLDLSMRILAANELGLLSNENSTRRKITKDLERLTLLQNNIDGSWPADSPLFKIRINGIDVFYGGREISTIFASKALDVYYKSIKAVKIKTRLYKDFMY